MSKVENIQAATQGAEGNEPTLPARDDVVSVEVRNLAGVALDWAVAKCEGVRLYPAVQQHGKLEVHFAQANGGEVYSPSDDWAQGGPIIGRERINIQFCRDLRDRNGLYVHAEMDTHSYHGYWRGDHEKPLAAAMRCYVASKFRASIEVPAFLLA